jgi:tyrosyl-tRNA synthetase
VENYFELLTDYSLKELPSDMRERQKLLALKVVSSIYGKELALKAQEAAISLSRRNTSINTLEVIPKFCIDSIEFPIKLFYLLRVSGLCKTSGEARREIQGGSARLDGKSISDVNYEIQCIEELNTKVLQVGKKKFVRLEIGR